VPVIESANAMGHGQMSGATMMKTVPGTPNGCSTAYAATNATYPHGPRSRIVCFARAASLN